MIHAEIGKRVLTRIWGDDRMAIPSVAYAKNWGESHSFPKPLKDFLGLAAVDCWCDSRLPRPAPRLPLSFIWSALNQ